MSNCTTIPVEERLRAFRARSVAGAEWHFGTIQAWQEGNTSAQEMADEIWQEGAPRLVLTVARAAGAADRVCDRAVLALPASAAPSQVYPFVKLDGTPPEELVLRATRKQLLESVGGKTDELEGEEFHYVAFEDEARTRGIVYSHHYPHECGEESGSASGAYLWRYDQKAKRRLTLLASLEYIPSTPQLALDLDRDGALEIVYAGAYALEAGLLKRSGDTYESVRTVEIPFYD
jgi:hypothetical protein